jgi:probable selenate reductase FAD-binding subunit
MIKNYHHPKTIEAALELLVQGSSMRPLGGGTILNAPSDEDFELVDLQSLGLDKIEKKGNNLIIGATATLQSLLDTKEIPVDLKKAIQHEATFNLRQTATVAGTLVSANGRSAFVTAMLALDAQLLFLPGEEKVSLGEFLALRAEKLQGKIITEISIPSSINLAYEFVARSPADLPIVCVAVTRWSSGRTRVVLGGHGEAPLMVVDGKDQNDILPAIDSAYLLADDQWASAEYRVDVAKTLTKRCLSKV